MEKNKIIKEYESKEEGRKFLQRMRGQERK